VEEGAVRYAPGASPSTDTDPRYHVEKRRKDSWAVLDRQEGDVLVALTKYKKGAEAVIARLEAYELRIAELSQSAVGTSACGEDWKAPFHTPP
jgi:hypothetical protein